MNLNTLILSPTGRPVHKFGDLTYRQFESKSYTVSIEWHQEARSCEPIMCIWSRAGGRGAGVFGICLSSIAKYADPDGGPSRIGILECWRAMPTLGRQGLDIEVFELMDVILKHTPDLIACPPAPPAVRRAEAAPALLEITQKDINGKTHSEVTV